MITCDISSLHSIIYLLLVSFRLDSSSLNKNTGFVQNSLNRIKDYLRTFQEQNQKVSRTFLDG